MGVLIGIGPILAALGWSKRLDILRERANGVRAEINATANRVLGGESVLAVRVDPATGWRPGRVHLSTPGGLRIPDRERVGRGDPASPPQLQPGRPPDRMSATEREEHAMRILMVITPESTAYGVSAVRSATQMARSAAGESGWRTYARSHPRA